MKSFPSNRVSSSFHLAICLCVFVSLWLIFPRVTHAQIKPVYDQGALGLGRLLKRLNTTASAMMIGAHPDDEDTALLAYLARGENARTAYLSLTRGDGGQNIIGPELGEALGVIRTEELLQARKLDGAEQYFTRAYDYGFSKTLDEAKAKWDEKVILCDTVSVIRNFRPLVVISQFSGTTADGHGQHQFAGYIAPIAVKAAADATQCTEAGPTWQVKKFYVRHRGTGEPTLRINTGKYDPLLGRSYFEIAMEARSQHKSQEQGVLELKGDQFSNLKLVGSETKETGIFDGLDISLRALGEKISQSAARALSEFDHRDPARILPLLIEGYSDSFRTWGASSIGDAPDATISLIANTKAAEFSRAILLVTGIQIDALADRETISPGEDLPIVVKIYDPASRAKVLDVRLGWPNARKVEPPAANPSAFRRETATSSTYFSVHAYSEFIPTRPYWLMEKRTSDLFNWGFDASSKRYLPGQPFGEPVVTAQVDLEIAGKRLVFGAPVEFRYADDIRGEVRRDLNIVPAASVEMDQPLLIVPYSTKPQTRQITMSVTNNSSMNVLSNPYIKIAGNVKLTSSDGWKMPEPSSAFDLKKSGEKFTTTFDLTIPGGTKPGSYRLNGEATVTGRLTESHTETFSTTMRTLSYPHIQTHRIYQPATAEVKVIALKTNLLKVGYLAGSGDRVPDAMAQMGFGVETINEKMLSSGDLSRFQVIVVGIRAYQVRPDIVANNRRLLDFANAGGTLIVQYQLPGYTQQNLVPFPAQQGPRVSDERAKVTILETAHPIFNTPNKITDADFEGWVQERNLYNFSTMDPKYTGLLESHDANEAENKGGLVVADVGKGRYIYCSYSLFRQLPAGVPGAYRLLANMLAYSGERPRRLKK